MDSWLVTCPNWARASSVLVGMGFARATPPMADNASATAIESVIFEDMLASFLAGSVPAHRFVLHHFAACFMGDSLGAGWLRDWPDPNGNRLPSPSAGTPCSESTGFEGLVTGPSGAGGRRMTGFGDGRRRASGSAGSAAGGSAADRPPLHHRESRVLRIALGLAGRWSPAPVDARGIQVARA